jgi:hypothetical protein
VRPPRNPFRLRTSEQIDDDWRFVDLYEAGLVDLLPKEGLWDRRVIVRSSPGGGKTTLLRLFTPGPLRIVHRNGARHEQTSDLYQRLSHRDAIDRSGPRIAAALVPLAGKYAPLDQLASIDEGARQRIFLALLNSRILLGSLRAHLQTASLRFPDDLEKISVKGGLGAEPREPTNGLEILAAASALEGHVAKALSSLRAPEEEKLPGVDELSALAELGPGRISVEGREVRARSVVLLDDVHQLSARQRKLLMGIILAERTPTAVWVAERREALTPEELLAEGAKEDRDRVTIDIEQYWRRSRKGAFKRLVEGIADRRMSLSLYTPGSSFQAMLRDIDEAAWARVLPEVEAGMIEAAEGRREFEAWVEVQLKKEATARERAIGMRSLQIRIARELSARQLTMDVLMRDEEALHALEQRREASNLREAAELFLSDEFNLPFYYGAERLAELASANLDQFLDLGGDLFEELAGISGSAVLSRDVSLVASRQQELIERSVKGMWNQLGSAVESAARVRGLLDGIGAYCAERTYLPNAPYAPAVTGVALRRSEAEELQRVGRAGEQSWQAELARTLGILLANNLLTVQASEAKGQRWAVFYLNRALCVRYRLALGYGGWQACSPEQLRLWAEGDAVGGQRGSGGR